MDRYFNRLKERVSQLGNHHQKYIRTIERYLDPMVKSLEDAGKIEDVHIWRGSRRLSQEMDIILAVTSNLADQLTYLACYYSLQMLFLNLRSIDVLKLNLTSAEDRHIVYKNFMLQTGAAFRTLTGSYMQKLLELFFGSHPAPEFVMLGVGSLAHQDDIDVGVVDDGSPARGHLNEVIGKIRNEMFKWATELHFYLSEHVGSQFYSASIQEYQELLDRQIQDFVIISEMLNAVPILGNQQLFEQFEQQITSRYYYHSFRDNKFHEGYLRGVLGEIRSLLLQPINAETLNPKDDALRMVSISILAAKTIFRIFRGNRWDVLHILTRKDSRRKDLYIELEKVLTFLEIFRHLYQLFSGLEEDIYLDDPATKEQLQIIAKAMGYEDVGAISAWDHLLIHYHEHVAVAKKICTRLIEDVTDHLKSVSIFSHKLKAAWYPDPYRSYPGNLAVDFLRDSYFFKGAKFWNDILEALQAEDSHVLENFVKDFRQLPERYQKVLIEKYGYAARNAIYTMMAFLIILWTKRKALGTEQLCYQLNEAFLDNLRDCDDRVLRLVKVFHQYPDLINNYLSTLPANLQSKFCALLDQPLWEMEQQRLRQMLVKLCQLHCNTSHYFKRCFTRVVSKHPIYLQYLQHPDQLTQMAKGIFGRIDSLPSFEEQEQWLGEYHDLEFMRVGLEALNGEPIEKIDAEFTEFSDSYLMVLFDICKQAVNEQIGHYFPTRDLIAIYTAGGYAREQAFDDDYDLIILLNEKHDEIRQYCNRIVTMMNTQIVKRGIMPHYRFADYFGDYITPVDDLDQFLAKDHDESFIDKSQLLGARMIVGSSKFQQQFEQRIIERHIYQKYEQYKNQMIQEMISRQQNKKISEWHNLNVKEAIGGLRDIEMLLLIYKARYRLKQPVNRKLMETICEIDARHKEDLCQLNKHFNFLKQLRDLYRLTVFAGNDLKIEYLEPAAKIMGYQDTPVETAVDRLVWDYYLCTEQVHEIIERLLDDLKD